MTIQELGFTPELENYRIEHNLNTFEVGRVVSEHKDRYVVKTSEIEFDAELIGNLRYSAENRYDLPAVGDWVAFSEYDEGKALIHSIYPRKSVLERKAVGSKSQIQIIATNIDYGLIVQAVDRDYNLNRLERYLTICNASKVVPIVVLSKIDLIDDAQLKEIIGQINQRLNTISIITVSNQQEDGYKNLKSIIQAGKTYCLLGSSGVGKSTLLNAISGESLMQTGHISSSVQKGRHITSHRELKVLDGGGIIIDNPGMREVGIADTEGGLELTFEPIIALARKCKFKNCTHNNEIGCAIIEAVENGEIDQEAFANFRKMEKETAHFESNAVERKKKDKAMGKMIKQIIKQKKKDKF